jgi:hypothetical protein
MPPLTPLPALDALERSFLECRARLLELAAHLDRIDRGGGVNDPRLEQIHQALTILRNSTTPDRAERVQLLFSRPYDQNWRDALRPEPRYS